MALPIITDTMRVSVEGLCGNGIPWANVLHFRKTGALTYTGAIALLDPKLFDLYGTNLILPTAGGQAWFQNAPTVASLARIRYTPLDGTSVTTINTHAKAGFQGVDSLPASVALVCTPRTAQRGRSYRGRCYWGPFAENCNDVNGRPNTSVITGVSTQWNNFLAGLTGSGVNLVVASYLHSTAADVVNVTVDPRWDSQRRRLG